MLRCDVESKILRNNNLDSKRICVIGASAAGKVTSCYRMQKKIAISGHTPVQSGHSLHLREKKNLINNLKVAITAWRQVKSWTSNQMKHLEGSEFWSDYREGRTLKMCYSHKKGNTLTIKAEQKDIFNNSGRDFALLRQPFGQFAGSSSRPLLPCVLL